MPNADGPGETMILEAHLHDVLVHHILPAIASCPVDDPVPTMTLPYRLAAADEANTTRTNTYRHAEETEIGRRRHCQK